MERRKLDLAEALVPVGQPRTDSMKQARRKPRKRLAALSCLALVALVLVGCNRQQQQTPQVPPAEVATLAVKPQSVTLRIDLPGHTAPFRIAEIRPQVNGLILKRLFEEGSDVKQGQELYQIDPAPFQAALDNATAALRRAEANLPALQSRANRYKQAFAEKAVSNQDLDDAMAALRQGEADVNYYKAMVESARINLNYARVASPINGRIGASSVTDGATVTAYQPTPLATIQQLDPIYVDVPQSATDVLQLQRRLQEGQISREQTNVNRVELVLPDGSRYAHRGTMQFRDVSVDPTTGSVILRMVFPNPDNVLLPGMFVRAVIVEGVNSNAILVPQQAVSRDPKGNPVALVVHDDGKVAQRRLTLDRAVGNNWLVSSGLKNGDRIIVEGSQKVRLADPNLKVKEVAFLENSLTQDAVASPPNANPAATDAAVR